MPEPEATPREQRVANAVADYLDLKATSTLVDVREFCSGYPGIEQDLSAQIQAITGIDDALGSTDDFPQASSTAPEPLPETLSGHRILGVIGSGGMGQVLLAEDQALGRRVAIKVLQPRYRDNPQIRTRFMQEARAMARLHHPNIVHIYNLGAPEEIPHFVMEHIEGKNLVETAATLPIRQRIALFVKVVRAVDHLHRHGIVHRDLKPGNILVGPDLEPQVLDFGLAQSVDEHGRRLTLDGQVMGTPEYFSPEQALGDPSLDARSDLFSLGTILYVLLTGVAPFRGESLEEQVELLGATDPVLPRRLNSSVPGDLQNVCLVALEKKPADRYGSAGEMANDLDRFLAGEDILAIPTSYSRLMSGKVEQHLQELKGWKQDQILSDQEFDAFRRLYSRLFEKEDAWIGEVRRLSTAQVTLYLGAWMLVVGAALVFVLPEKTGLSGTLAVLTVVGALVPTLGIGIRAWRQNRIRTSIAYLLASCLLLPILLLVGFGEWGYLTAYTHDDPGLEFWNVVGLSEDSPRFTTNLQMWWALLASLPFYLWLRRFTRSTVFSLVLSIATALFSMTTLLTMGMLEWEAGRIALRLLPIAGIFFVLSILIERLRLPEDARYFYPVAVLFMFAALTGLALYHEGYRDWLNVFAFTREQIDYLFIVNAGWYFGLQAIAGSLRSPQMRVVARAFRFVIPGHIMTPLWLLGIQATTEARTDPTLLREAHIFQVLLPAVACFFVYRSIPRQMKNYLASGLVFLMIGLARLQLHWLEGQRRWPISLLVTGLILMILATNYTPIKLRLQDLWRSPTQKS